MVVRETLFWLLLILSAIGAIWEPPAGAASIVGRGRVVVVLILIALLGWQVFHT